MERITRYKYSKVGSFACLRNPKKAGMSGAGRVKRRVVQDEVGRVQIRETVNHCQETS